MARKLEELCSNVIYDENGNADCQLSIQTEQFDLTTETAEDPATMFLLEHGFDDMGNIIEAKKSVNKTDLLMKLKSQMK